MAPIPVLSGRPSSGTVSGTIDRCGVGPTKSCPVAAKKPNRSFDRRGCGSTRALHQLGLASPLLLISILPVSRRRSLEGPQLQADKTVSMHYSCIHGHMRLTHGNEMRNNSQQPKAALRGRRSGVAKNFCRTFMPHAPHLKFVCTALWHTTSNHTTGWLCFKPPNKCSQSRVTPTSRVRGGAHIGHPLSPHSLLGRMHC